MAAKSYDAIDLSSIKLAPPKVSKAASGCKTSKIQGFGARSVLIQTPPMTLPWDIAPRQMDENSNVSANLSLSFLGMDDKDDDNELYKFNMFMRDFDIKIKTLIGEMGGTLGKKSEDKNIDANFKDSIKESSNGDYPSTIQPKIWLNMRDGGDNKCVEDFTMDITVYNFDGEEIGCNELRKGCPAAAIIEPSYVWCSALGLGITWVAKQVAVKPAVEKKFGFTLGPTFDHLKESPAKRARVGSSHEDEGEDGSQGSSHEDGSQGSSTRGPADAAEEQQEEEEVEF